GFMASIEEQLPPCVFADRYALAQEIARNEEPPMHRGTKDHGSRCHFHEKAQDLPRVMSSELGKPLIVDRAAMPLLKVDDLAKRFNQHGRQITALAGVSGAIWPGETLGLVGESGSGKTTFAQTLPGLVSPSRGTVGLHGPVLPPHPFAPQQTDLR